MGWVTKPWKPPLSRLMNDIWVAGKGARFSTKPGCWLRAK